MISTAVQARGGTRAEVYDNVRVSLALIRASPVVSMSDANDLRTYFGEHGMSSFDRSTMAAMLARAELFAGRRVPCRKCGGNPKTDTPGCGYLSRGRPAMLSTVTDRQRELLGLLDIYEKKHGLPPAPDQRCPECRGCGWIVLRRHRGRRAKVTARPTGSSVTGAEPGATVHLSDADMHLLGVVSRRLARVEYIMPGGSHVLEVFYGASQGDGGRALISLWSMTSAGKRMLKRNRVKDLDPIRFFANLRESERQKPDLRLRALFKEANEQARELRVDAARAWNLAGSSDGGAR